jgi:hypothetical protein
MGCDREGVRFVVDLLAEHDKESMDQLISRDSFLEQLKHRKAKLEKAETVWNYDARKSLIKFIDHVVKTMENLKLCNKRGKFLDCTCKQVAFLRYKMCGACSTRRNVSLDSIQSQSKCECAYCIGRDWVDDTLEGDYDLYKCACGTLTDDTYLEEICTVCILYLGLDFLD